MSFRNSYFPSDLSSLAGIILLLVFLHEEGKKINLFLTDRVNLFC